MVPDAYDFWLFDLDGTVVDAEWSYTREVFDRVGDRLGREFTDRQAEVLWHGLEGSRDPKLREWGIDPAEFWPAFHAIEDPATRAEATYLHDDAARLLSALHEREVPVGVVTHCAEFLARPVVEHLDVADWFDVFVACSDDTGWKPDPAPVETAMSSLGVDPTTGRGVLLGDGASDVGAAWNAGLDAVHVERHGYERRGRCVRADYRVRTFDELPRGEVDPDGTPSVGAAGVDGMDRLGTDGVGADRVGADGVGTDGAGTDGVGPGEFGP